MTAGLAQTPLWQELQRHKQQLAPLRDIALNDVGRLDNCQIKCSGLTLNYALQRVTAATVDLLCKLAEQQNLADMRERMFRGELINVSENRAVLHSALRQKGNMPVMVDGKDVLPEIQNVRQRMAQFANDVRSGKWRSAEGKAIKHIVNIGIGGSDLGPRLAVQALSRFAEGPKLHFVANVDAFEILSVTENLDPAETMFIVVSKTFTTQETLLNARTARKWLSEKLGKTAGAHFIAVSANIHEVTKFGIPETNIFPIWDFIGGRYSLWSAVGLSIMFAIGPEHFDKMLDGAATMDDHFRNADFSRNMPVILALLNVWNRDFLGATAQAILPYSERLRDLPRFLQQLEMESNGKTVTRDGKQADYPTCPVIFGECGTVGQHSFHQWLHQGSDIVPADFIGVATDDLGEPDHHRALAANLSAQATALAFGRQNVKTLNEFYPGGRPSNVIILNKLDPFHFGLLIALYEHKAFVEGAVWGLNPFDQPGVELGKQMAKSLENPQPGGDKAAGFMAQLYSAFTTTR